MPAAKRRAVASVAREPPSARLETTKHAKANDEDALENWLFGGTATFAQPDEEIEHDDADAGKDETAPSADQLFVIDRTRRAKPKRSYEDEDSDEEEAEAEAKAPAERAPAWHDEDDEEVEVDIAARARSRKLRQTPAESTLSGSEYQERLRKQHSKLRAAGGRNDGWAALPAADAERDSVLDALVTSRSKLARKSAALPSTVLDMSTLRDANHAQPNNAVTQTVAFHPSAPVLITGGFDRTLRIFQMDGKNNSLMQSVAMGDFPIHTAQFARGGQEVVLASRRSHFYVYDIEAGRVSRVPGIMGRPERSLEHLSVSPDGKLFAFGGMRGEIILVSAATRQLVGTVKMGSGFVDMAWSDEGRTLYSMSENGEVYEWDVAERRARWRFQDEGALHGTSIAATAGNQGLLACGSNTGIVNFYDVAALRREGKLTNAPVPAKALMNLTTSISSLHFNHDGQLLLFASRSAKASVRAFHTGTRSVFGNWPRSNIPLGRVNVMETSPHSGFLAIGNDKGRVLLNRLNYYAAY